MRRRFTACCFSVGTVTLSWNRLCDRRHQLQRCCAATIIYVHNLNIRAPTSHHAIQHSAVHGRCLQFRARLQLRRTRPRLQCHLGSHLGHRHHLESFGDDSGCCQFHYTATTLWRFIHNSRRQSDVTAKFDNHGVRESSPANTPSLMTVVMSTVVRHGTFLKSTSS